MAGQKRTRSGEPKPHSNPKEAPTISTPPCGQAQPHSSKTTTTENPVPRDVPEKKPRTKATSKNTYVPHIHGPLKRPRLPDNATISKRPLLHPAIPTPFSSAANPKVLYITASSPFIPTCKRVRSLLVQISKREAQSAASASRSRGGAGKPRNGGLEANGRLEAKDVEASIAGAAKDKGRGHNAGGEEVFLKATGRAIPRALELGVKFQGEGDCRVRVELGSVKAIDDVEVNEGAEVDQKGTAGGEGEEEEEEEEEVPETRIRTLSTVTVCIGLK
ncbi:Ribonuclease P [Ascochyta rabiei]|uniref:Uncharacterized protein n=1 Tax=Didymella rabiei TaxID=5454 RepID=A0A162XJ81_DIDRA|nr:Ribonuclease P [Ascochyta rabiei]KZM19576.1 hypothetical protein ST47_g9144 [Ascochyta rabiei]UPX13676.1 Ribonuclease P [Ascochyta rabiei]